MFVQGCRQHVSVLVPSRKISPERPQQQLIIIVCVYFFLGSIQDKYNQATLDLALNAIFTDIANVSKICNIPSEALMNSLYLRNISGMKPEDVSIKRSKESEQISNIFSKPTEECSEPIEQPISSRGIFLSADEEKQICQWVHKMTGLGFMVTLQQLQFSASKLMIEFNHSNSLQEAFNDNTWHTDYFKRFPSVKKRLTMPVTTAKGAPEEMYREWFASTRKYFEENKISDILTEPSRIFNCSECGCFLSPKDPRTILKSRHVFSRMKKNEYLTLLLGSSADGKLMPILTLLPSKKSPEQLTEMFPRDWTIVHSVNGWMSCEDFYDYVVNIFNPFLEKEKIKKPVVIFLDGNVTYTSAPLSSFCSENGIILLPLLPHWDQKVQIVQPMDPIFESLELSWRKNMVVEDFTKIDDARLKVEKNFGWLLQKSIAEALRPEVLRKAFEACGLYPLEPKLVIVKDNKDVNRAKHFIKKPRAVATWID